MNAFTSIFHLSMMYIVCALNVYLKWIGQLTTESSWVANIILW